MGIEFPKRALGIPSDGVKSELINYISSSCPLGPQGKLAIKAAGESDKPQYDDTEYARVEQTAIRLAVPLWLRTELFQISSCRFNGNHL